MHLRSTFRPFVVTILALSALTSTTLARPLRQSIGISMSPASSVAIASNGSQIVEFTAVPLTVDYLTNLEVSYSTSDCANYCTSASIPSRSNVTDIDGAIRLTGNIFMPALPAGVSVSQTYNFVVTAYAFIESPPRTGIIPRASDAPNAPHRIVRQVAYFTLVVNGNGPPLPTDTPIPPSSTPVPPSPTPIPPSSTPVPPSSTPQPLASSTPPISTATATPRPAGPSSTPPPAPPSATAAPGTVQPSITPTASPTINLAALTRRFFLPISARISGPEREPNNEQSTAQSVGFPVEILGAHNDLYDVYSFTLPVTTTVYAEFVTGLDPERAQVAFIKARSTVAALHAERSGGINAVEELPPGVNFVYVYTDPQHTMTQASYRLKLQRR